MMNVCCRVELNLLDHAENISCFVNRLNEGNLFHNRMIGEIFQVLNCENPFFDLKYFVLFILIVVTMTVLISILPYLPRSVCISSCYLSHVLPLIVASSCATQVSDVPEPPKV